MHTAESEDEDRERGQFASCLRSQSVALHTWKARSIKLKVCQNIKTEDTRLKRGIGGPPSIFLPLVSFDSIANKSLKATAAHV